MYSGGKDRGAGNYTVNSYLFTLVSDHSKSINFIKKKLMFFLIFFLFIVVPQLAKFGDRDVQVLWHSVLDDIKAAGCTKVNPLTGTCTYLPELLTKGWTCRFGSP